MAVFGTPSTLSLPLGLLPRDLTFSALADPTRRAILTRLAEGEATVNELAEPFPISLPAISRHLSAGTDQPAMPDAATA